MSSLTITLEGVPDELHAMTATPEGMARARAAVLDAFGLDALDELLVEAEESIIPEPVITEAFADELQDMCDGIEAGTIKVTPWDSKARRERTAELLKREFGYEAPANKKDTAEA
jgi:hypothetical protein